MSLIGLFLASSLAVEQGEYYLVREEGGIAVQRVVYKLPNELFQLLESGRKSLLEIDFYVKNNC